MPFEMASGKSTSSESSFECVKERIVTCAIETDDPPWLIFVFEKPLSRGDSVQSVQALDVGGVKIGDISLSVKPLWQCSVAAFRQELGESRWFDYGLHSVLRLVVLAAKFLKQLQQSLDIFLRLRSV